MEKFDIKKHWKDFINNKLVVNCETEELAKEFLQYCHEQGIKWRSGNSLLYDDDSSWEILRENTCYFCKDKFITYGSKKSILELGFGLSYNIVCYYKKGGENFEKKII